MSTSPYMFEDLATAESQETIRARLMAALLADGQPTASWAPSSAGGVENLRADMVAGGLAFYMAHRIANFVNGRILPLATDSAENGYFLTYLGLRFYKLTKRAATFTIQNVVLGAAVEVGAQQFRDGDLWVASSATGNKYRLTLDQGEFVTIIPGGVISAPFRAEFAGSKYSDAAGTITTMVTAKAGITCVNRRASDYAPTRQIGNSSGTIGGFSSTTPTYTAVRFRIDADGNVGAGAFSWSTDGGLTWTFGGVIPTVFSVPGGGTLTFTNGGVSPSFLQGSIFTLLVADNFLQRGADPETDGSLRSRCSNRWPALSLVPTKGKIELWAHEASLEVAKVMSRADPNTPGGILVTIASGTGPATPTAQAAVEDYILPRLRGFKGVAAPTSPVYPGATSPQETALVTSATRLQVQALATVMVPRDQMAAAMSGADQAWNTYLAGIAIGGQPGAVVQREDLYTLLGDLGADDVQGLTLNGVGADLSVPSGKVAVPADGWTLQAKFNWVPV